MLNMNGPVKMASYDMAGISAPPRTRIPDQAWRYHRSRQEFRLRFFQRTGAGDHQGTWHPLRDRQILCPDLLPQFHQQRASAH